MCWLGVQQSNHNRDLELTQQSFPSVEMLYSPFSPQPATDIHLIIFAILTSSHTFCKHSKVSKRFWEGWLNAQNACTNLVFSTEKKAKKYVSNLSSYGIEFENTTKIPPRAAIATPRIASLIGTTWQKDMAIAPSQHLSHTASCPAQMYTR